MYQNKYLMSSIPDFAEYYDSRLVNTTALLPIADKGFWLVNNGNNLITSTRDSTVLISNYPRPFGITNAQCKGILISTESGTLEFAIINKSREFRCLIDERLSGSVFKGLTSTKIDGKWFYYVANFSRGFVQMYNDQFELVNSFTDKELYLQSYYPYNVKDLGGKIVVTFAKTGIDKFTPSSFGGYVIVFDKNGNFERRLVSNGNLNAPYGLALFEYKEQKSLIVGNNGNGNINVYDFVTGDFIDTLASTSGTGTISIALPSLYDIYLAERGSLYFVNVINSTKNGIYGKIRKIKK